MITNIHFSYSSLNGWFLFLVSFSWFIFPGLFSLVLHHPFSIDSIHSNRFQYFQYFQYSMILNLYCYICLYISKLFFRLDINIVIIIYYILFNNIFKRFFTSIFSSINESCFFINMFYFFLYRKIICVCGYVYIYCWFPF